MAYWPSKRKAEQKTYSLCDGLNLQQESIEIKDSQCTSALNMDSSLYPTLSVRDGYVLSLEHTGKTINHIQKFNGSWYQANDSGLYKWTGTAWNTVHLRANEQWYSVVLLDKLYFVNGWDKVQQYDGTTLTAMTQSQTGLKYITSHANRLFAVKDNTLYYTDLRRPTQWEETETITLEDGSTDIVPSGAGEIVVETPDGEKITGIKAYADHVMVFKRSSFHELFGTNPDNFSMRQSSNSIGCIDQRSVIEIKGLLYWLGADGVYQYAGGSAPKRISDAIEPRLQGVLNGVGGTDGRYYFLAVGGKTMVYDTDTGAWWEMSYNGLAFYLDGQDFYFALNDRIMKRSVANDYGTAISWEWVSKTLTDGDEIRKKNLHKLYVIADIDVGSTFNVYYSPDSEGSNWISAGTVTATNTLQNIKLPIIGQPSEWIRIKLSGTGKVKIHRLIREMSRRG